jgi:hypothetical protein
MTQPFYTVEAQSGKKGETVNREDTIKDVNSILEGKLDSVAPEKLMFIGSIGQAKLISTQTAVPQSPSISNQQTTDASSPNEATKSPQSAQTPKNDNAETDKSSQKATKNVKIDTKK